MLDDYKRVMPLKLIKLKAIQLVKLLILVFCLISLYFIYVERKTSSYRVQSHSGQYEFRRLRKKYSISLNESTDFTNKNSFSLEKSLNQETYFCLNNKLNCTNSKVKFCSYVPVYLSKFYLLNFV